MCCSTALTMRVGLTALLMSFSTAGSLLAFGHTHQVEKTCPKEASTTAVPRPSNPGSPSVTKPHKTTVQFREDGESLAEGQTPPGWYLILGNETGRIYATSKQHQLGRMAIAVDRDQMIQHDFNHRLIGHIVVELWMFARADHNTNFVLKLGNTEHSLDLVSLHVNESHRWWFLGQAIQDYSETWTKVRILIDTDQNHVSIWLDNKQVVDQQQLATNSLRDGIDSIGFLSGRAGIGHVSYFDELVVSAECSLPKKARYKSRKANPVGLRGTP